MFARRTVLPHRSVGLRGRYYFGIALGFLFALAGVAGAGGGAWWVVSDVFDLQHEQEVWDKGVPPEDGAVNGKTHSKLGLGWFIKAYDLDVTYVDSAGTRHAAELSFMTMFGGPDTDEDPELRYDPAHPDDFALSWALDAGGARWRKAIVLGLLFGLLCLVCLWLVVSEIPARARLMRRCAREGDEVVARVTHVKVVHDDKGKPTTRHLYTLVPPALTGGDDPEIYAEIDHAKGLPLFADSADQTVFALYLRGATRRIMPLVDGFAPLALNTAEKADAKRRADAARDASSGALLRPHTF